MEGGRDGQMDGETDRQTDRSLICHSTILKMHIEGNFVPVVQGF